MFDWMTKPIGSAQEAIDPANYSYEADGLHLAFEEAYSDLADINIMFAHASAAGTNVYAQKWHEGGEKAAQAAMESYQKEPAFEGFLGDVKDKLVKLLTKLKDKIKAFFHSAVQYFDAFFKDGAAFAEKYEDELSKKDLNGFKFEMYEWKIPDKISDQWDKMKSKAMARAKSENVAVAESFGLDVDNIDWVAAMEMCAVMEEYYIQNVSTGEKKRWGGSRVPNGWKQISHTEFFKDVDIVRKAGSGPDQLHDPTPSPETEKPSDGGGTTVASITSAQKKAIVAEAIKFLGGSAEKMDKFKKDLRKEFQGGRNDPKEIKPNIDDVIKTLKDTDAVDAIKDAGDAMLESIDDEIDKVKDADKSGDEATKVRNSVAVFTCCKDVYMGYFDVYKDCIKARESQYKNCLSKALHFTAKED